MVHNILLWIPFVLLALSGPLLVSNFENITTAPGEIHKGWGIVAIGCFTTHLLFSLLSLALSPPTNRSLPIPINVLAAAITFTMFVTCNLCSTFMMFSGVLAQDVLQVDPGPFAWTPQQLLIATLLIFGTFMVVFMPLHRAWFFNDGLDLLVAVFALCLLWVGQLFAPGFSLFSPQAFGEFLAILAGLV